MKFIFTPTAEENYARLTPQSRKRIREKLRHFASQPNPLEFAESLTGSAEYRFRIGDYRVIFEVLHNAIWITAIKRRDEAYR
jgi:mRNA-degrading endonuclease RelE of RelBE toxin-antitoxin system